jgi:endoglucanase
MFNFHIKKGEAKGMKPALFSLRSIQKALMLCAALMVAMGAFLDASALGRRQLHCSAGKILDESNNTVILRGFGLGDWLMTEGYMWGITSKSYDAPREMEAGIISLLGDSADAKQFWKLYHDNYTTEKDFCTMKAWGVNAVRVGFNANLIQPRDGQPASAPYIYDPEGWRLLDNVVNWCTKNQLWIIWDMHGAPGGQSADNIADADGTARLWTQPTIYQPRAIDLWMQIVRRYADNDWIIGYNLLNEPLLNTYGIDRINLRNFYIQCTDSIRTVDNKGLLFIDGDNYAQNFTNLTPPWDPQVVYDFHCYPQCCSYFGLDGYATQYGTPFWHGETGESGATDPYTGYTNCVTQLEAHNPPIGWSWWTIKKFNNVTQAYDVIRTSGFQKIIDYWNGKAGATKPSADSAKKWLFDQAIRTNSDSTANVTYLPNLVKALKLHQDRNCAVAVAYHESVKPVGLAVNQRVVPNSEVVISFTMPASAPVRINVFDLGGRLQKTLVDRTMAAGKQCVSWDRTNMNGKRVASGVYFYTFTMGDSRVSHHFVLAK